MSAAVTRELSIIYGNMTIGGSTDYHIDGKIVIRKDYVNGLVSCDVVIAGAPNESVFESLCSNLEAAFRTPRQRLRVVLGSETLIDWDPSTNSGFDAVPNIEKAGDDADTGRSRRYTVSVEVTLPADLAGQSGRRHSTVEVSYSPSRRRTLTISGEYTALGPNDSTAQYTAAIDAYCTAVYTALGGYWELDDENYQRNDTDKVLQFSRTYEEIIFPQGFQATSDAPDDPHLVRTTLTMARHREGPGDAVINSVHPQRLIRVSLVCDTHVDKTQSTDLRGKFENSLRPWLITHATALGGFTAFAIVEERAQIDPTQNTIHVQMDFVGLAGSGVIECTLQVDVSETSGLIHVPVWDGRRFSYYEFRGHGTKIRTVDIMRRRVMLPAQDANINIANTFGNAPGIGGIAPGGQDVKIPQEKRDINTLRQDSGYNMDEMIANNPGHGWRPISCHRTTEPEVLGLPGAQFQLLTEQTQLVEMYIERPRQAESFRPGSSGSTGLGRTMTRAQARAFKLNVGTDGGSF